MGAKTVSSIADPGAIFLNRDKFKQSSGKSAKQLQAEAKAKADKLDTARRAAIARNVTSLVDDEEPDMVYKPKAQRSVLSKKKLG